MVLDLWRLGHFFLMLDDVAAVVVVFFTRSFFLPLISCEAYYYRFRPSSSSSNVVGCCICLVPFMGRVGVIWGFVLVYSLLHCLRACGTSLHFLTFGGLHCRLLGIVGLFLEWSPCHLRCGDVS